MMWKLKMWMQQMFYTWSGHVEKPPDEPPSLDVKQALKDTFQRGIAIGKKQVPPPVYIETWEQMCQRHKMPLSLQTVQLSDGTLVEGWFCPYWHEHSTAPMPHIEQLPFPEEPQRNTDRMQQLRPNQLYNHLRKTGAGTHTAAQMATVRPTRNLKQWRQEQGE